MLPFVNILLDQMGGHGSHSSNMWHVASVSHSLGLYYACQGPRFAFPLATFTSCQNLNEKIFTQRVRTLHSGIRHEKVSSTQCQITWSKWQSKTMWQTPLAKGILKFEIFISYYTIKCMWPMCIFYKFDLISFRFSLWQNFTLTKCV